MFLFELGEGIGLGGDLLVRVFNVCVDLRGVQILVPEHLLQRLQVDAVGRCFLTSRWTALTLMRFLSREPKSARLSLRTICRRSTM